MTQRELTRRNLVIFVSFREGISVEMLAEVFELSQNEIRKIVRRFLAYLPREQAKAW